MSNNIRLRARMLEAMSDFIEQNRLGFKIARQKLGKTPQSIVVEKIGAMNKLGRTGIVLLRVNFNSNEGRFDGLLAIKEFASNEEANRLVKINDWLMKRIENNPRVEIPQIFSAGGKSIVYEGIEGLSYEESKQNPIIKLRMAGNAIATFHTAFTSPVSEFRYYGLLQKMVQDLPISEDRKQKLLSFGHSYLIYYNTQHSGVISYGDFHPGNIMLSPDGEISYLIDPEFVENEIGADRFEDISNFLVFDAYMEFLNKETLTGTFEQLRLFLDAYDTYLQHYDTNLNTIYQGTQWLAMIFHLGLVSLIKGAVAVQAMKNIDTFDEIDLVEQRDIEEIIQSYRLCRAIWLVGVQYLPKNAIPRTLAGQPSSEGFLITWPFIYRILLEILKHDNLLGLLFRFPQQTKEITFEAAIELYKVKDKKSLANKIKELDDIVKFETFKISKKTLEINLQWSANLGLQTSYLNPKKSPDIDWKENSDMLYRIWRKNPSNMLISVMSQFHSVDIKELESSAIFGKNLKNILKVAEERKIINMTKETVILNSQWKFVLGIPYYFDPSYFN